MHKIVYEEYLKQFFESRIYHLRQKCNRNANLYAMFYESSCEKK